MASFTFGLLTAIAAQIPSLDPEHQAPLRANTYVYANDGHSILAVLRGNEARVIVPSSQISPWLKHAIVAVEDRRFYEHRGVDVHGIVRAVWADVSNGNAVQGGSTITQQFIKNSETGNAPTITRKLREAALAWQLEQQWSKDKILTAYLNTIYFGNGAYGVEQASHVYFDHKADTKHINPAEAALLAGIPADPSLYDPVAHPKQARERRNFVLLEMYQQDYLSPRQYRRWVHEPLPKPQAVRLPTTQSQKAPYFANYVTNQLVAQLHARKVYGGGLRVTTTIDLGLQKLAREAIARVLPPTVGPTAAFVALDARTGAVLAMVGGRNYHRSQFNLATQGERQPGSSFKPFVLAAALKAGISPLTTIVSHRVTINAGGRLWQVNNYEGEYLGPIDLAKATAYSDNTVFAQLTNVVGPKNIADTAAEFGIGTPLQAYFAIGLGAEPATPLDMARAYSVFANGGNRMDGSIFGNVPRAVQCYSVQHGPCKENKPIPRPVMTSTQAAIEDQLLQGVISYGTGTRAQIPGRAVAGKTGTTENFGDAWFVGFTPEIVAAVWVGYPDKLEPMLHEYHGRAVAGGTYPALIWKDFMTKALDYLKLPSESFPSPPSLYASPTKVVFRNGLLRRDNGFCATAVSVEFFSGFAPTAVANCKHNEVEVPDVRGSTIASAKQRLIGQPLEWTIVYKPAKTGQRLGIVIGQFPLRGTLSAYDKLTLVLPKAQHGVVPRLVGLTVKRARAKAAKLRLDVHLTGLGTGRVVSQAPRWGVAAAPGMRLVLKLKN